MAKSISTMQLVDSIEERLGRSINLEQANTSQLFKLLSIGRADLKENLSLIQEMVKNKEGLKVEKSLQDKRQPPVHRHVGQDLTPAGRERVRNLVQAIEAKAQDGDIPVGERDSGDGTRAPTEELQRRTDIGSSE